MNIPNDAWPYIIGFGIFLIAIVLFAVGGSKKETEVHESLDDLPAEEISPKNNLIAQELQKANKRLTNIDWTLRVIAFALGVILLYGVKLTIE